MLHYYVGMAFAHSPDKLFPSVAVRSAYHKAIHCIFVNFTLPFLLKLTLNFYSSHHSAFKSPVAISRFPT